MIGSVVERLCKPDADRGVPLVPVLLVDLFQDGVRIELLGQELGPSGPVALHRGPEGREVHVTFVDSAGGVIGHVEQVPGVGSDEMTHRLEDRAVGSGHGGLELLGAELDARIDHLERRPHVVPERVLQHRPAHAANVAEPPWESDPSPRVRL